MKMNENLIVSLKDIVVDFDGQKVLDGLSLDIHDKEFVTFLGPSGCGKTTLLRAACGLLPLQGGQVLYDGKPLGKFGRKEFARLAAILPQTRDIPSIRAGQLVAHGRYPHLGFGRDLTKADREKIAWAMEATGTAGLAEKELSQLSGGEQQRVSIGRALINRPAIVLADEPTGNLDKKNSDEIVELLRRANQEYRQTIIMITHNLEIAKTADRVIVIEDGKIIREG